ncbi:hypothetical protein ACTFIU_001729, partial [Dictyostelium citrinum]
VKMFKL